MDTETTTPDLPYIFELVEIVARSALCAWMRVALAEASPFSAFGEFTDRVAAEWFQMVDRRISAPEWDASAPVGGADEGMDGAEDGRL